MDTHQMDPATETEVMAALNAILQKHGSAGFDELAADYHALVERFSHSIPHERPGDLLEVRRRAAEAS